MARRFKRKRNVVRRRRRTKKSFGHSSAPQALKYAAKLKYHDEFNLNPGVSSATTIFSANGVYDPNITSGGHQFRGFDQIMPMYDHYVCVGSTITCTFQNKTDSALYVGIALRDSTSLTLNSANDYIEGSKGLWKIIPATDDGSPSLRTIKLKVNPNKFLSRSHPLSDPELKGSIAANPAEQCYYHVWTESMDGSTVVGAINCSVLMSSSVLFIEPKTLVQS